MNDFKNHPTTALLFFRFLKGFCLLLFNNLAGVVGLEPTTNGFGDHYSTN